jgi:hypothetical protein
MLRQISLVLVHQSQSDFQAEDESCQRSEYIIRWHDPSLDITYSQSLRLPDQRNLQNV